MTDEELRLSCYKLATEVYPRLKNTDLPVADIAEKLVGIAAKSDWRFQALKLAIQNGPRIEDTVEKLLDRVTNVFDFVIPPKKPAPVSQAQRRQNNINDVVKDKARRKKESKKRRSWITGKK